MKPIILYRLAAVLLVLFAAGHQLGFRTVDPAWQAADLARWAFAASYTAIAVLTWTYFFVTPGVFATLIAIALTLAVAVPERAA